MSCAAFVTAAAVARSGFAGPPRSLKAARRPRAAAAAVPRRRGAVRMSLIPFVPNWLALAAWAYGSYRFYGGFSATSYERSYKLPLTLLWPLFLANGKYRANFKKALKAGKD